MSIQKTAKAVAKKVFVASGALRIAYKFAPPAAVILRYHSIQARPEQYANIIGCDCIHATSSFEWQMEVIARRFNAVSMDDILLFLQAKKSLPKRAVVITFDDGFKDNVRVAAPILNRFGIPATFYVLIGAVDRSKAPWYCLLRHAFFTSRNLKWMDPFSGAINDLKDAQARENAFLNVVGVCAKASAPAREKLVEDVVRSLDREPFPNESDLMMNWDDARSLVKSGHIVGSHTMTHPNVAHISAADARNELNDSKVKLEEELGEPVKHFSYPHPALNPQWNETTLKIAEELGYATAVTTTSGAVRADTCPLAIPRTYMSREKTEFLWHLERTLAFGKGAEVGNLPCESKITRATLSQEVRLAGPPDLARIAQFLIPLGGTSFAERFPDGTVEDFYRWKYFGNPLGNAIVGIAAAADSVVSVVAATPKRIWISGKIVLAYELGDFLTDENYRGRGLFSQLIELVCREAVAHGSPLVYVRPNDVSFPILTGKLSFHEAQRIDARRFVVPSHTLSRKTGIPGGLLRLSGIDWLLKRRCIPRSPGSAVIVVPVERFGVEMDQLWQRASSGYDFALVRDSSYLNWRFSDCPTRYKIWVALRNGQAVGFLVTSANRTVPTAAVVDLFTESNDGDVVRALLAMGIGSLLNSGVQSISTWTLQGSAPASELSVAHHLLQRAFLFRRKPHLHLAFRVLLPEEITLPLPSQKWHFALADSDGD